MTRLPISPGLARTVERSALWGVAAYGALMLSRLPGDGGAHVLCGPWGCLPPLQALGSAHLFWMMILAPAALWSTRSLGRRNLTRLGGTAVAVGATRTAMLMTYSFFEWAPHGSGRPWWHAILHAAIELAMFVDVPLVELIAVGGFCLAVARRTKPSRDADCLPAPIDAAEGLIASDQRSTAEGLVPSSP